MLVRVRGLKYLPIADEGMLGHRGHSCISRSESRNAIVAVSVESVIAMAGCWNKGVAYCSCCDVVVTVVVVVAAAAEGGHVAVAVAVDEEYDWRKRSASRQLAGHKLLSLVLMENRLQQHQLQ